MIFTFMIDDVERIRRETGVSREEAARLLRGAGGDYKRAMREYIGARNVCVEPEKVEDNTRGICHSVKSVFSRLRCRRSDVVRVIAFVLVALAAILLCRSFVWIPALPFIFVRLCRTARSSGQAA